MLRLVSRAIFVCALFLSSAILAAEISPLPVIAQEEVEKLTIDQLTASSAKGDAKAQAELGARYARGDGVPVDTKKAISLFEQSVKKNEPNGQYYLGTAYNMGVGVKQDATKAAHWFGKAAANNHAGGQYALGVMMTTGQGGLKTDPKAAAALVLKSAEQGYVPAAFRISQLHIAGIGVEKDTGKAAYWLRRILKGGENQAAAASLVTLIETGTVKWQPGDPGATQAGGAQRTASGILPSSGGFTPSQGPDKIATFKESHGIALESRSRDGYVGIFATSAKPYTCEILVDFSWNDKAAGMRRPGQYLCYMQQRPAGNKVLACESSHPNYVDTQIDDVRITRCQDTPAK